MSAHQFNEAAAEFDSGVRSGGDGQQLLSTVLLHQTRSALRRLAMSAASEAVITIGALSTLCVFARHHIGLPRFAVPATLLALCAVASEVVQLVQITSVLRINYRQPAAAVHKQVEALVRLRERYFVSILLGAPLAWTPLLIVSLEAAGLDAYRTPDALWLCANVLVGLAIVPISLWSLRRLSRHGGRSRVLQQLANGLAGDDLAIVADHLSALCELEPPGQHAAARTHAAMPVPRLTDPHAGHSSGETTTDATPAAQPACLERRRES